MAKDVLSRDKWQDVRASLENGVSLSDAAALHGVSFHSVQSRAYRCGYSAKSGKFDLSRDKSKVSGCVKGKIAVKEIAISPLSPPVFPLSSFIPPPVSADAAASDFSAALVPHVQALIAAGLPGIEPPRNIAELKTLIELGRKLAGLDQKQSSGKVQLFAPLRDVSRRGGASSVVVECENSVQTVDCGDSIEEFEI